MQLISIAVAAVAGLALSASAAPNGLEKRADYRQLVTFADNSNFCNQWRCACVNYVPQNSKLYFKGTLCEAGDYQGQNNTTEAKVFCLFTNGKSTTSVIKHIAAATNATISS